MSHRPGIKKAKGLKIKKIENIFLKSLDIAKNNLLLYGVQNTPTNTMIFNSSIITIITSTTGKTPDGEMLVV